MGVVAGLTWRQAQALLSIYWRSYTFGKAEVKDLVGDLGVAFSTLFDHLRVLEARGLVVLPPNKLARNLSASDRISLTEQGIGKAEEILRIIGASRNELLSQIYDKLQRYIESFRPVERVKTGYFLSSSSSFSKAINEIIKRNPTEPVATTIAMYSDLDTKLWLLKNTDKPLFMKISRGLLNIEIRVGRIASIALPVGLRGQISIDELDDIISNTWSWPGIVGSGTKSRYFMESKSLGLFHQHGRYITTLNTTTSAMLQWLASHVYTVYLNNVAILPKAALIVYREIHKGPALEELLYPSKHGGLDWLEEVRRMTDESTYRSNVRAIVDLLVNKTGVVVEFEGRFFPEFIIRKIQELPEIQEKFRYIVKEANQGNKAARILLLVISEPGVTLDGIISKLKKRVDPGISARDIEIAISMLAREGLIHVAKLRASGLTRLYSFTHIPFIGVDSPEAYEVNSVLRSIEPWLLSHVEEFFYGEEKKHLISILEKIVSKGYYEIDSIENEYGRKFLLKTIRFVERVSPILTTDNEYTIIRINPSYKELARIIIDTTYYSLLTGNEALGLYAPVLSDTIERDKNIVKKLLDEATELKTELMKYSI